MSISNKAFVVINARRHFNYTKISRGGVQESLEEEEAYCQKNPGNPPKRIGRICSENVLESFDIHFHFNCHFLFFSSSRFQLETKPWQYVKFRNF